jgi:hypothetical protein
MKTCVFNDILLVTYIHLSKPKTSGTSARLTTYSFGQWSSKPWHLECCAYAGSPSTTNCIAITYLYDPFQHPRSLSFPTAYFRNYKYLINPLTYPSTTPTYIGELRQNSRKNRNLVDETQAHDGAHDQRLKLCRVLLNTLASYLPLTYPYQLSPACERRFDTMNQNMASPAAMCPKLRAALSLCSR